MNINYGNVFKEFEKNKNREMKNPKVDEGEDLSTETPNESSESKVMYDEAV